MSLDALAPDQRAVVQLVLQQDRSYEDLGGLLGITADAVRERAHRGLERLAPGEALADDERAQVSDYLLGQQSVSGREATRSLLSASQPARSWAHAVSVELAAVARSPLPDIPGEAAPATPVVVEPEATEPVVAGDDDPLLSDPIAPSRARPRPRQRAQEPAVAADFGFSEVVAQDTSPDALEGTSADGEPDSRSNRLGGALVIGGLAIFVAAIVIWLVNRGEDEPETQAGGPTTTQEATPTAAATPAYQALVFLPLKAAEGESGRGRVVVFAAPTGEVAINVEGEDLEPNGENEAYALWLVGGPENSFLGFTTVGEDGSLRTSGPREDAAAGFAQRLGESKRVVVSRETADPGTAPAEVVLSGKVANAKPVPTAAPGAETPPETPPVPTP